MVQRIHGRIGLRYCDDFRSLVQRRTAGRDKREFGFEYELIAEEPLSKHDFQRVKNSLGFLGFNEKNGKIICAEGMYITFEPGGQLEFSSPPLGENSTMEFDNLLKIITRTVTGIRNSTSVNYIPVPYIPHRADAPMVLEARRYHDLHSLLGTISDRGREMMKGTAAIHLHASLTCFDELLKLWTLMCILSSRNGFAMGQQRRDIWNRTDPSRCGLRCSRSNEIVSSEVLFEKLVCFALRALELQTGIPFGSIRPIPSFEDFLGHFTTIFTDVRLNTKGMTLELRTLDSRPLNQFRSTWSTFLNQVQSVMDDSI